MSQELTQLVAMAVSQEYEIFLFLVDTKKTPSPAWIRC